MHYQEQQAMNMQTGPKWRKEKKEVEKNKIGGEKSSLDNSKSILFNPLKSPIKQKSYYSLSQPVQTKSSSINFLLDSGASNHFVNNRNYLMNFKPSTEHCRNR